MEENTRLTDLTRMLLSSPSFSGFLDTLAQNPSAVSSQPAPSTQAPQRQVRKDVNPYNAQQQVQNQQIGLAMIPEQTVDFSMLDLNTDGAYSYQPQVFSVFGIPETPIDTDLLSGKSSNRCSLASEVEKVELPVVERAPAAVEVEVEVEEVETVDQEFDADPAFALFVTATPSPKTQSIDDVSELLSAIPAKPEHFSLVVEPSLSSDAADVAMRKVDRICDGLEQIADRLRSLTVNL